MHCSLLDGAVWTLRLAPGSVQGTAPSFLAVVSGWTGRARDLVGPGVTRVEVTIRENILLTNSKETFIPDCCSQGEESGSCNRMRGLQPRSRTGV